MICFRSLNCLRKTYTLLLEYTQMHVRKFEAKCYGVTIKVNKYVHVVLLADKTYLHYLHNRVLEIE